jgi:hypothetical protein
MLPEGQYELLVDHGAGIPIEVNSGTIDCGQSAALNCVGTRIEFKIVSIEIDPGQYPGPSKVLGIEPDYIHGTQSIKMLPGIVQTAKDAGYSLALEHSNNIRFNVTGDGRVDLNDHYKGAAVTDANKLTLKSVSIHVDAGNYVGDWQLRGAESRPSPGSRDVTLVPHSRGWILQLAPGVNARFDLLEDGTPSCEFVRIPFDGKLVEFRLSRST